MLFARLGFDAVTTKQLAAAADVATGALYHHFPTKEAIYGEVVRRAIARRAAVPEVLTEPTDDPESRLVEVVAWFVRTILADDTFRLLLGRELLDPDPSGPQLFDPETFADSLALTRDLLARIVPQVDPDLAIASLLAMIYGFSNLRGIYQLYPAAQAELASPERIAAHATSVLLDGLRSS